MCTKNEYPHIGIPVENSCGQTCGECGKLRVINRYFSPQRISTHLWNFCIPPCIWPQEVSGKGNYVTGRKRSTRQKSFPKSLQNVKFRCHILLTPGKVLKNFVKNPQSLPGIIPACRGILSADAPPVRSRHRRHLCREK